MFIYRQFIEVNLSKGAYLTVTKHPQFWTLL